MELPLSAHRKDAVAAPRLFPCRGSLIGFNAQGSFSHAVLWGAKAWMEVLKLIFQHVLGLPPLQQQLWCVQMWWHWLVVTEMSPRCGIGMLCGHAWGSPALLSRSCWSKTHFKGPLKSLGSALQEFQELLFVGKGQAELCFLAKVA